MREKSATIRRRIGLLLAIAFLSLPALVLGEGPTWGHWPMEGPANTCSQVDEINDFAANNGTKVGFPGDGSAWQAGILGRSVQFDGIDDVIELPAFSSFPPSQGSIEHWLLPSVDDTRKVAFYVSDSVGGSGADYNGFGAGGNALEIHTGIVNDQFYGLFQDGYDPATPPGNGIREVQGGVVRPEVWTHVALSWDVDGDLTLYVDCQEVASVNMADATFQGHVATDQRIGSPSVPNPLSRYWTGRIDELRVSAPIDPSRIAGRCPKLHVEDGDLAAAAPTSGDRFGTLISADGEWLVISNSNEELHWYRRQSPAGWNFETTWTSANGDPFADLDLDGTTTVVSYSTCSTFCRGVGSVDVLEKDQGGTDAWGFVTTLAAEFGDGGDFGRDVAIVGDRIVVSSPNGTSGGSFYVFGRDEGGAGAWGQIVRQTLPSPNEFGRQIALDGELLVVGSDGPLAFYEQNQGGADAWGYVTDRTVPLLDTSALTLDLLGDGLLVGPIEFQEVVEGLQDGYRTAVLRRNLGGVDAWGVEDQLVRTDNFYGYTDIAAVRWLHEELAAETRIWGDSGFNWGPTEHESIYLFESDGAGNWSQKEILLPGMFAPLSGKAETGFGDYLFGDEDVLLAGAPRSGDSFCTGPGSDTGRVVLFTLPFFDDGFESGDTSAW